MGREQLTGGLGLVLKGAAMVQEEYMKGDMTPTTCAQPVRKVSSNHTSTLYVAVPCLHMACVPYTYHCKYV